ncbi:hypothetical protein ACWDUL_31790 [Nocardia niigatensis]|uniref:hypothetical protein n=1 Tax=Nocardia niigatensis TaxID=209249 RepID=UPI0012F6C704|nr:hypothetical protein [Nocardia niigatensis]
MRILKSAWMKAGPAGIGLAVAVVALCAGCGTETGGSAVPAGAGSTAGETTVAKTTSSKESQQPSDGLPAAANGTDLGACSNGNCEVRVDGPTTIPVPGFSRISSVKIGQISPGAVTASTTVFGLPVSGSTGVGGTIFLNGLTVKIVAVHGNSAVLRLST